MRVAFDRAGRVTQTRGGVSATFARVGDEVMGGDPMGSGVVFTFKVLKLEASANSVELHIKSYSGQAGQGWDDPVHEKNGVAKFTYTLNGNQLDVRYEGTGDAGGRTEVIEMGGTFQRVGGGGNGGNGGGGW